MALDLLVHVNPVDLTDPARLVLPIGREMEGDDGFHQPVQGDDRRPYEHR